MYYLITIRDLHNVIQCRDKCIKATVSPRILAEDGGQLTKANTKTKGPQPNDDPAPYWLSHNSPNDWYGIGLDKSRPPGDENSSDGFLDGLVNLASGQYSPKLPSWGSQFGPRSSKRNRSEPSDFQDEDRESNEELESAHVESAMQKGWGEWPRDSREMENVKAEVEMLRLQVKALEDKDRANKERELKRGKLYAEFLPLAPGVQQEGWLMNKVRKAYAACQKIVEVLELED